NPAGRVMMLNSLPVRIKLRDGRRFDVGWVPPVLASEHRLALESFVLELGLPVWRFRSHGITLERRVIVSHGTNPVMVHYRLLEGGPLRLEMRPGVQFRGHDEPVSTVVPEAYPLTCYGSRIEVVAPQPLPSLRLHLSGAKTSFVLEPLQVPDLVYST